MLEITDAPSRHVRRYVAADTKGPRLTLPWQDHEYAILDCSDAHGRLLWRFACCYTAVEGAGLTLLHLPGRLSIPPQSLPLFGITLRQPRQIRYARFSG